MLNGAISDRYISKIIAEGISKWSKMEIYPKFNKGKHSKISRRAQSSNGEHNKQRLNEHMAQNNDISSIEHSTHEQEQ